MGKVVAFPMGNKNFLEFVKNKLEKIVNLEDVDKFVKYSELLKQISLKEDQTLEKINENAESKLLLQWKGGELIANSPKNKGGKRNSNNSQIKTYDELGIAKHKAFRWQQMYLIPEEIFQKEINTLKDTEGVLLTDSHFLELAKELREVISKQTNSDSVDNQAEKVKDNDIEEIDGENMNISIENDNSKFKNEGEDLIDQDDLINEEDIVDKFKYVCPRCNCRMTRLNIVKEKKSENVLKEAA